MQIFLVLPVAEMNDAPFEIDACRFSKNDGGVLLLTEDRANRSRYIRGRKTGHGDLIKQWLEKMMIGAIDDSDSHGRALEGLRCRQPSETRTDDDDMW
jgi:hypothetical protein